MPDLSSRDRMIQSAVLLIGEHGVEGTSFSRVLEHSGAPRGSIYHHFPGGKAQLIEEATRSGGDFIAATLGAMVERADPAAAVEAVVDFWRAFLGGTDFAAGCPVVAATVEGDRTPAARDAAQRAFGGWIDLQTEILQRAGVPKDRARSLGTLFVAAIEGAVILSRAERSTAPLDRVLDELRSAIRDAGASVDT
jgi:TetR/AcrR family transcriptional regulator, lmrAB and yxaGH operons repressor